MNAGPVLPGIAAMQDEMIALRQSIHAHPELGFEEFATSERVAACLTQWGYEVTKGVGIPAISQRMLTIDLCALEQAGLVKRTVFP